MQEYLKSLGVAPDETSRLWKMRQMLHGANRLSARHMQDVPRLANILAQAVAARLTSTISQETYIPPGFLGVRHTALLALAPFSAVRLERWRALGMPV